jgi:TPP-dependent pyruvate/acetoin dehydrogenase alpha subunit
MLTAQDLIDFETDVAGHFAKAEIHSPVHFSGGNETPLLEIFSHIKRTDYVLSTWRNHYHALLHGIPRERVLTDILAGKSMTLNYPEYKFLTSAIVGGTLPIACGLAAGGERVWCFVGDMCASTGAFHDAVQYVEGLKLPVTFVVEDNGLATNTPTSETWGDTSCKSATCSEKVGIGSVIWSYQYSRKYPHVGLSQRVQF